MKMAKPKGTIALILSNVWVIILLAIVGIALLSVTVAWLMLHKALLAVVLMLFFAVVEGLGVRLGFIKVEAYKWMPLVLLFFPFIGFLAGYGLEMRGFFVTPLDSQPAIPMYGPTTVIANATILLLVGFLIVVAITIFVKPKQP
jgi:hypothetical protein